MLVVFGLTTGEFVIAGILPDVATNLSVSIPAAGLLGGWVINGGLGLRAIYLVGAALTVVGLVIALYSLRRDREPAPVIGWSDSSPHRGEGARRQVVGGQVADVRPRVELLHDSGNEGDRLVERDGGQQRLASTDVVIGIADGDRRPRNPPALEYLGRQADHRMIGEIGQPHRGTPGERVRAGHAHHARFRCQRLEAPPARNQSLVWPPMKSPSSGTIEDVADIQFGVCFWAIDSPDEIARFVRRADELGYDVLAAPDHLGWLSPFAVLAAAAVLSERLRLRTYVLNGAFWNATLLAREIATLDVLSHGRAELGLGTGYVRAEFERAGVPWQPLRERVTAMMDLLDAVRAQLADADHQPRMVQESLPVMIGGNSDAILPIVARHAEIVGFPGLHQRKGAELGRLTFSSSAQVADRVAAVRAAAGGRAYRSDIILQTVMIDKDPLESVAELAAQLPDESPEILLDAPAALLAKDATHAAAELRRRHAEFGFDSVTVQGAKMEEFGEVIAAYRAGAGKL
jgi:probable F420-dependent oxidoreductase